MEKAVFNTFSSNANIRRLLITFIWLIIATTLDAYITSNTGCQHNGTWYGDKSLVPTTEKCLNCQCNRKTLVCRLKVCPEMPLPPPRGCIVVQKKNTCCPYLTCARLETFYKIPATRRIIAYLDHYERESIDRVVNDNMLQRRSDDSDVDLYVCVKNGTVYKSGSAMSSSNLCTYCYCIGGTEKCVKPKCMLPVEGCKPIFVDSTCCPVRYDCSSKSTGKSSQEVRYRKTSNKHYLRMSQRLQRNRGCTVHQQFYAEGQKMKSDADKPCDVCFCIRGHRKCAPKKCAPALRNCIPVVPKGQCCPSSYDCGSQRDYRRSQNSRQFNLFSLLFGNDDEAQAGNLAMSGKQPTDMIYDPYKNLTQRTTTSNIPTTLAASTEKSIFDSIREGLEFIDSNTHEIVKNDLDMENAFVMHKTERMPSSSIEMKDFSPAIPTTTEVSLLDLLLEPSEIKAVTLVENDKNNSTENNKIMPTTTASPTWMDVLMDFNQKESTKKFEISTTPDFEFTTDTIHETTYYPTVANILNVTNYETATNESTQPTLMEEHTTNFPDITNTSYQTPMSLEHSGETLTSMADTTTTEIVISTQPNKHPIKEIYSASQTTEHSSSTESEELNLVETSTLVNNKTRFENSTSLNVEQKTDLLTALLDGISDMLNTDQHEVDNMKTNSTLNLTNSQTVKKQTMPIPVPHIKPIPLDKTYTRINSKITNLTHKPIPVSTGDNANTTYKPIYLTKPNIPLIPLSDPTGVSVITPVGITTRPNILTATLKPMFTTSSKPIVINTNPTILETEPLDENVQPTLPPSLPNLKIIPFLPTDAVKADHTTATGYNYYHHGLPSHASGVSRIDFNLYDDPNHYPSITSQHPLYADIEDGNKAEYTYKFNIEVPDTLVSSTVDAFDSSGASTGFINYDYSPSGIKPSKGFSPPTKTEGGFIPKEPLLLDVGITDGNTINVAHKYHVTPHIIDITTASEPSAYPGTTSKIIEITTSDPFKDVIKTEPPPNLASYTYNNLLTQLKRSPLVSQSVLNEALKVDPNSSKSGNMLQAAYVPLIPVNPAKSEEPNEAGIEPSNAPLNDLEALPTAVTNLSVISPFWNERTEARTTKVIPTSKPTIPSNNSNLSNKQFNDLDLMSSTQQIKIHRRPVEANQSESLQLPNVNSTLATVVTQSSTSGSVSKLKTSNPNRRVVRPKPNKYKKNPAVAANAPVKNTLPQKSTPESAIKAVEVISTTAPQSTAIRGDTILSTNVAATLDVTHRLHDTLVKVLPNSTSNIKNVKPLVGISQTFENNANVRKVITSTAAPIVRTEGDVIERFNGLPHLVMLPYGNLTKCNTISNRPLFSSLTITQPVQHSNTANQDLLNNLTKELEPTYKTASLSSIGLTHNNYSPSSGYLATIKSSTVKTYPNTLLDPIGILAGCNIYGRMYRVGRIIVELSNPCLECRCTETGVKCGPLKCK